MLYLMGKKPPWPSAVGNTSFRIEVQPFAAALFPWQGFSVPIEASHVLSTLSIPSGGC